MAVALDEYGRPFMMIIMEQEQKPNVWTLTSPTLSPPRSSLGPTVIDNILQIPDVDLPIMNGGATILEQMDVDNQIAKLIVELSRSQDYKIGEGTIGGVVMAGSLLDQAEKLWSVAFILFELQKAIRWLLGYL